MDNSDRTEAIYRLVPAWRGNSAIPENWEFLEGGYSNNNYAFDFGKERYVLRMPLHSAKGDELTDYVFEHSWYQGLPNSLGVRPFAYDVATGQMISPWIEGELLVEHWRTKDRDGLESGDHALLLNYLTDLHHELPTTNRVYEAYNNAEAQPPAHFVTCHNDLNPWNIIIDAQGRWHTLDWEWVGLNDPVFDIVSLHQGLEINGGLRALVGDYLCVQSDQADQRAEQAIKQFWQRELDWAKHQINAGNERAEVLEQAETADAKLANLSAID